MVMNALRSWSPLSLLSPSSFSHSGQLRVPWRRREEGEKRSYGYVSWEKFRSSDQVVFWPLLSCPSSSYYTSWHVFLSSSGSCSGVYVWHLLSGLSAIHHCPHASWWRTLASTAHCSVSNSGIVSAFIWRIMCVHLVIVITVLNVWRFDTYSVDHMHDELCCNPPIFRGNQLWGQLQSFSQTQGVLCVRFANNSRVNITNTYSHSYKVGKYFYNCKGINNYRQKLQK